MAQLWLIIGIALGAGGAWLALRARIQHERESAADHTGMNDEFAPRKVFHAFTFFVSAAA